METHTSFQAHSDTQAQVVELPLRLAQDVVSTVPADPTRTSTVKSVQLDSPSTPASGPKAQTTTVHGARKLLRRDSLDRREAVLRGKEGSRARRRWENDRLLNNPHAEPPLPSDWEIRPTYPRRTIPYYLAPLWDAAEFQRAIESKLSSKRRRHGKKNSVSSLNQFNTGISPMEEAASNIPKEIRARLKHARSAKGLLQDLEEDVRSFVRTWNERQIRLIDLGLDDAPLPRPSGPSNTEMHEDEDEEIVFVGRNGAMHDMPGSGSPTSLLSAQAAQPTSSRQRFDAEDEAAGDGFDVEKVDFTNSVDSVPDTEKLVFQALESDKGAGFARWLVHCVGHYYGLRTWSVTRPVHGQLRREAYVGIDARARGFMGLGRCVDLGGRREVELPRPLWCMV